MEQAQSKFCGPPYDKCPYCWELGRGAVPLVPTMMENEQVRWLCKNGRICPFPSIYGRGEELNCTVPRNAVDPALLGFFPSSVDDTHLKVQDSPPDSTSTTSYSGSSLVKSPVSSINGTEAEFTELTPVVTPKQLPPSLCRMINESSSPEAAPPSITSRAELAPVVPTKRVLPMIPPLQHKVIVPSLPTMPPTPRITSEPKPLPNGYQPPKRRLNIPSFPGYIKESNATSEEPAAKRAAATADLAKMVAKKLKKMRSDR